MSTDPFRSFFDQGVTQIIHLMMTVLYKNIFVRLQQFLIHNTVLLPADTKDGFFDAIFP